MRYAALIVIAWTAAAAASPALAAASDDLFVLAEEWNEDYLRRHPSAAIAHGDRRYLDRFETDLTDAYLAEGRRLHAAYTARLRAIDREALGPDEQLSYDILHWELVDQAGFLRAPIAETLQLLPVNQMWSAHLDFAREMQWSSIYPFNTTDDYERAISRMEGFARWIDQAIFRMRQGMAQNITLPRVLAERVLAQVTPLANPDIDESGFMGPVTNMPSSIEGADRARLSAAYRNAIRDVVVPAYGRLRDFIADAYLPAARETVGLFQLPHGREIYLQLAASYTTTDISPDEIHGLGLAEIGRIESEMERVRIDAGFEGTLEAFKAFLRNDPGFKFENSEAMGGEFARIKSIVEARLGTLFDTIPRAELEMRFVPDFAAPSSPAAFYSQPAPGGARPGLIYLNAFDLPSRPLYTADALFLHEGIPGHHLQLSLAIDNENLPEFRRHGGPNAFIEGWALYAETLGPELGLYADPYRAFGRLSFDAWRAARLVIDTGIHWLGWTREEAIAYLLAHTALTETDAIAEVERYIAIPGQALSYKIGQQSILALRARAESALGERFDIRRFHNAVLADGAMPLPILDAKIERWLAEAGAR